MLNFTEAAIEKPALTVVGDQLQRSRITLRGFAGNAGATQQIGASRVEQMIIVEIAGSGERIDEFERGLRAIHHGDRYRPVQRHDRRGLQSIEKVI